MWFEYKEIINALKKVIDDKWDEEKEILQAVDKHTPVSYGFFKRWIDDDGEICTSIIPMEEIFKWTEERS